MRRLRLQRSFGVSQGCEIVGDKARRADSDDGAKCSVREPFSR
jgi:hypothetical protein